jgi:hypothetical protein
MPRKTIHTRRPTIHRHRLIAAAAALAIALLITACGGDDEPSNGGLPQGSEAVELDPADFTTNIDNRYWPMKPGTRWISRETDTTGARERVVLTATDKTKKVASGITARVITDVVTEDGEPV